MALLCGIDVGTTHVKVGFFDDGGGCVTSVRRPTPRDLPALVAAVVEALAECAARAGRGPDAIGITGMAETGVPLDASGRPLTPLLWWNDPRGTQEAAALRGPTAPMNENGPPPHPDAPGSGDGAPATPGGDTAHPAAPRGGDADQRGDVPGLRGGDLGRRGDVPGLRGRDSGARGGDLGASVGEAADGSGAVRSGGVPGVGASGGGVSDGGDGTSRGGGDAAVVYARTGRWVDGKAPLAKWLWLRAHEPGVLAAMRWWASVPDAVAYALTGELHTHETLAARTLGYDVVRGDYDEDLLALAGLRPEQLAPTARAVEPVGGLTVKVSGVAAGIPVMIAGHDHAVGAWASGVRRPGHVADSMGTAEAVLAPAAHRPDPRLGLALGITADPALDGTGTVLVGGLPTSGGMLDWLLGLIAAPDDSQARTMADRAGRGAGEWGAGGKG
ncbi:FGGY family carbohydrate kinase, partial [Nonomuraea diastatica]